AAPDEDVLRARLEAGRAPRGGSAAAEIRKRAGIEHLHLRATVCALLDPRQGSRRAAYVIERFVDSLSLAGHVDRDRLPQLPGLLRVQVWTLAHQRRAILHRGEQARMRLPQERRHVRAVVERKEPEFLRLLARPSPRLDHEKAHAREPSSLDLHSLIDWIALRGLGVGPSVG